MRNYFFVSLGILAASCSSTQSSNVKPSAVFTSYSAVYNQTQNQLQFSSNFTVGGSTGTFLILDGSSQVSVDGTTLSEEPPIFNIVTYEWNESGVSQFTVDNPHTFVYVDNSGTSYTNTVMIPGAIQTDLGGVTSSSITKVLIVDWNTQVALNSSETLTLTISNAKATATETQSETSGTSGQMAFTPVDLNTLGTGSAQISICRSYSTTPASVPAAGGIMTSQYCGAPISVVLTP